MAILMKTFIRATTLKINIVIIWFFLLAGCQKLPQDTIPPTIVEKPTLLPTLSSPVIGTPMPFVITENTHGCSKTTNITLISGTHVPTESLNVNVGLPSHNCPSGSFLITANASATGGWGTYTYSWYPSQIVTNANCGQQLTCTVTDIEGCYKVSTPITI